MMTEQPPAETADLVAELANLTPFNAEDQKVLDAAADAIERLKKQLAFARSMSETATNERNQQRERAERAEAEIQRLEDRHTAECIALSDATARIAELQAALRESLEDVPGWTELAIEALIREKGIVHESELCTFCGSDVYDPERGIVHRASCQIAKDVIKEKSE